MRESFYFLSLLSDFSSLADFGFFRLELDDGGDGRFVEGEEDVLAAGLEGDCFFGNLMHGAVKAAGGDDFVALFHGVDAGLELLTLLLLGANEKEVKHRNHQDDGDNIGWREGSLRQPWARMKRDERVEEVILRLRCSGR